MMHAEPVELTGIRAFRDEYRREMACQVIHDSIHARPGWTIEYGLQLGATTVGYGSVAVAGPWADAPTAYEFYLTPDARCRAFDLFEHFLEVSQVQAIEMQSNDSLGTAMLHAFVDTATSQSILFRDDRVTSHPPSGAVFRHPSADEASDVPTSQLKWRGVVEQDGVIAATGGVLFHYNRPYADIYMDVSEPFRRRGLGTFMVEELKRLCREGSFVPGARCNPANRASRRTLQKAGFVPCGHILTGRVRAPGSSTA